MIGGIADELLDRSRISGHDTIGVTIAASTDSWIAEHAIESRLKAAGHTVILRSINAERTPYVLSLDGVEFRVRYDDMFSKGIFGTKMVRRTLSADISSRLLKGETGEVLFGGSIGRLRADTVAMDEIKSLEMPGSPATHGEIPEGSPLDRFIEPFIIIGTTGVAVYLFFHLRS